MLPMDGAIVITSLIKWRVSTSIYLYVSFRGLFPVFFVGIKEVLLLSLTQPPKHDIRDVVLGAISIS
jgi:hypothetical protein